jgi:hypothetical protein
VIALRRVPLTLALVTVALTCAACGEAAHTATTGGASASTPGGGDVAGLTLRHPIVGQEMPIAAATALVNFPVPQANVAAAGPSNLTGVWVNKAMQQLALVYDDGDVTVVMSPAWYSDPKREFSDFLSSNNATARLGSVNRHVALVISPHTDMKRSNPAWAEFDLNGVDVNVESATQGTAALLGVARSLADATYAQAARSS